MRFRNALSVRCGLVLRDDLEGLQTVVDEVDDLLVLLEVEFGLDFGLPRYVWFEPDGGLVHDGDLRLVVVLPHDVVEVDEAPLVVGLHV